MSETYFVYTRGKHPRWDFCKRDEVCTVTAGAVQICEAGNILYSDPVSFRVHLVSDQILVIAPDLNLSAQGRTIWDAVENLYEQGTTDDERSAIYLAPKNYYSVDSGRTYLMTVCTTSVSETPYLTPCTV